MRSDPYVELTESLILRDHLALDRTILANERTFLAYLRTGLALIALGATAASVYENGLLIALGWLAAVSGVCTALFGFWRYNRLRASLTRLRNASAARSKNAEVKSQS